MGPVISIRHLTKRFDRTVALDSVDFSSHAGVNIILGPNGAGKSTLLKCIDGLYGPESGTVRVFGRDPYTEDSLKMRLSLLTDNYALYDFLSVMRNMKFFGKLYGLREEDVARHTVETMRGLNAEEYLDVKVSALSRGTKQKAALCRALLNDPDALLMDEPTAFLDAHAAEAVREIMQVFAKEGKTVLFVTQKIDEVTRFNGKITVLRKGRVVKETTTEGLYRAMLKNSIVNVRVAKPISMSLARRLPFFMDANEANATFLKFRVSGYRDVNEIVAAIARRGTYVVSIDYTEPFIEELSV